MADAMDFEDVDFETHLDDDNGGESQRKRRKRVRNWTAEDRARHRVFERSRREAFNERLNELASLLPNLKDAKETQLAKHVIVDESVKHHLSQQDTINELAKSLDELKRQHEQLRAEFQSWRQVEGHPNLHADPFPGRDVAMMPGTHPVTSSTPPSRVVLNANGTTVPMMYDGGSRMQQRAPSQPRLVSSAFAGNLGSLVPNPTGADTSPALLTLENSVPASEMFEMPHTSTDLQNGLSLASTQSDLHEQSLQTLFNHFSSNATTEEEMNQLNQLNQTYLPTQHYPEGTEIASWISSPERQHLWRTQLGPNGTGDLGNNLLTAHYGEIDTSIMMQFRNAPTVNT